jgi:hypothetical protein
MSSSLGLKVEEIRLRLRIEEPWGSEWLQQEKGKILAYPGWV